MPIKAALVRAAIILCAGAALLLVGLTGWVFREYSGRRSDIVFHNDTPHRMYLQYMNYDSSVEAVEPGKKRVIPLGFDKSENAWYRVSCSKSMRAASRIDIQKFVPEGSSKPLPIRLSVVQACAK